MCLGSLLMTWMQGTVVMPMMRRLGSKKAFEVGSLFSAAGLLLVSQAWRPFGASKLRMVVQLATAMLVMMPGHVCGVAMVQQPLEGNIQVIVEPKKGDLYPAVLS